MLQFAYLPETGYVVYQRIFFFQGLKFFVVPYICQYFVGRTWTLAIYATYSNFLQHHISSVDLICISYPFFHSSKDYLSIHVRVENFQ